MPLTKPAGRLGLAGAAGRGAGVGALAVFGYTLVFLVYAFLRSGLTLLVTMNGTAGLPATLLATWVSLSVPALTIGLLLLPVGALMGLVTAALIWGLAVAWNRERAPGKAVAIGAGVCAAVVALAAYGVTSAVGRAWTPSLTETLSFWLWLPLALYLVAGAAASWELNRRLAAQG